MPRPARFPTALLIAISLAGAAAAQSSNPVSQGAPNVPEFSPEFSDQTRASAIESAQPQVAIYAEGLEQPWGMAALPGGGVLVTEKPGRLRHITQDGTLTEPLTGLPKVWANGQGGLLDIALGPNFATDRMILWTYAKPMVDNTAATAAVRGRLSEDLRSVTDVQDVYVQTPSSGSGAHFGSRIVFDQAGHVLITTGDRGDGPQAQDLSGGIGKVIRLALDGTTPSDNPFASRSDPGAQVYSFGHRNMQGATVGPDGTLWTIEHGPKGGDELNRPEPGKNYGWPVISYGENYSGQPVGTGQATQGGLEPPVYYWDPVIAPGGMTFYDGPMFPDWQGDLLIGSLNPGALVRLRLANGRVTGEERILPGIGRVRDVEVLTDGSVLLAIDSSSGGLLRLTR